MKKKSLNLEAGNFRIFLFNSVWIKQKRLIFPPKDVYRNKKKNSFDSKLSFEFDFLS